MYFTAPPLPLAVYLSYPEPHSHCKVCTTDYLPLIKMRCGLLYKNKEEEEKQKKRQRMDPRILQVCVPHQMGFPQFIPLPCNGLILVHQGQTSRQHSSEPWTAACHPWAPETPDLYCLSHTGACHKPT